MKDQKNRIQMLVLLFVMVLIIPGGSYASAEGLSGDDSLYSLGITTEGAIVDPEFYYSTIEYNVTVPAGTTELHLDPVPSNEYAYIYDISGTELVNGETTTTITVMAENGSVTTYYLYVKEEAAAETEPETEKATEAETEPETEPETEDSRYVSVARDTLEEAENTIDALKTEAGLYRDRVNLLMTIIYVMIALCVILIFLVINLLLKNRDIKSELNDYRGLDYSADQKGKKKKSKKHGKGKKEAEEETTAAEEAEEDLFDRTGKDSFYEDTPSARPVMKDDPNTVPKPEEAKKQEKPMPTYETPPAKTPYEPSKNKEGSEEKVDVDVDLIDL